MDDDIRDSGQVTEKKSAPTIVFIEAYGSSVSLLMHALRKGYRVIVLTANSDLRIINESLKKAVSDAVIVDTLKTEAVIEVVKAIHHRHPIVAVIPGFEYFVQMAARVSRAIGLSGMNEEQSLRVRNKLNMRMHLQRVGVKVPHFINVNCVEELSFVTQQFSYPVICKPLDAAGSVLVKRCHSLCEVHSAVDSIINEHVSLWGYVLAKECLIESFIEGEEFSVEGVVACGTITFFSITKKIIANDGSFTEIAHIVNCDVDSILRADIERFLINVIHALGLDACPFHAELICTNSDDLVLIEIAARLAGDKIGDLINYVSSLNYFDAVLHAYQNQKVSSKVELRGRAGIRFFYRPSVSSFSQLDVKTDMYQEYDVQEHQLYYSPHSNIPAFPIALKRLGHVIMKGDNQAELIEQLNRIDKAHHFI